jgi:hypothetical protein
LAAGGAPPDVFVAVDGSAGVGDDHLGDVGHQPVDQFLHRVTRVVALVLCGEVLFVWGHVEPGRGGQAEVGEVETAAVGQDVAEVGVEVQQSVGIHEGDVGA